MAIIGSIVINASVNSAGVDQGAKKTGDALKRIGGSVPGLSSGLGALQSVAQRAGAGLARVGSGGLSLVSAAAAPAAAAFTAVAAAAAAGVAAVVAFGISSMHSIDQLGDAAARLGTTTEALGGLRYAAKLTGSETEAVDAALTKFNAVLGDAVSIGGPAADGFKRLGLDAKQLATMDPTEAFKLVLAKLAAIPNQAQRASAAMDVFGKGALQMMGTISAGPAAVEKLIAEFKSLGGEVSTVDAAKIGAAEDAFDRIGVAVQGVGNKIAVELAPFIEVAVNKFATFIAQAVTLQRVQAVIGAVGTGVAYVGDAIDAVVFTWEAFQLAGMEATQAIISGVAGVIEALAELTPIGKETALAIAKNLDDVAAAMGVEINAQVDSMKEMLVAPSTGEQWKAMFDSIASGAQSAASSVDAAAKSTKGLGDETENLTKRISDLETKLKEQIGSFGMSSSEAEIYKLKLAGATDEQVAQVKSLAQQRDALELRDSVMNKDEKKRKEDAKVEELLLSGKLDENTAARAFSRNFLAAHSEVQNAGAAEAGSREAYSAIVKHQQGGDLQQRALEEARKHTSLLKQMADALKKGATVAKAPGRNLSEKVAGAVQGAAAALNIP